MAIIYISPQMGAGGPEIGMALAQRLGYRYVDQELLLDAARRYGLAEEKLSHLAESKPTLFERFDTETRHHITVLQTTCLEFAEDDNCVLMRGGGQWLVRGARSRRARAPRRPREIRENAVPLRGRHRGSHALRADREHREDEIRRGGRGP